LPVIQNGDHVFFSRGFNPQIRFTMEEIDVGGIAFCHINMPPRTSLFVFLCTGYTPDTSYSYLYPADILCIS
jgi:hypothetical protein